MLRTFKGTFKRISLLNSLHLSMSGASTSQDGSLGFAPILNVHLPPGKTFLLPFQRQPLANRSASSEGEAPAGCPLLSLEEGGKGLRRHGCGGLLHVSEEHADALDFHVCDFLGAKGAVRFDYLAAKREERHLAATSAVSPCEGRQAGELSADEAFAMAPPVFFVDFGRFHQGVRRELKARGWAQVHWCQKGSRHKRAFPQLEFFARVAQLVWIKNRSVFPFFDVSRGDQDMARCIFNHNPTEFELTKKDRLALNTSRYTRFLLAGGRLYEFSGLSLPIHPETYRLKDWRDCQRFAAAVIARQDQFRHSAGSISGQRSQNPPDQEGYETLSSEVDVADEKQPQTVDPDNIWILKPSKGSCGRGITLHSDVSELLRDFQLSMPSASEGAQPKAGKYMLTGIIAQRYISRPLLIKGCKFDVRSYLFIADARDMLVFFCDGYVRQNAEPYDDALEDLGNRFKHLSNVSVQKKHPDFERIQEEMRWKYHKLQEYLTAHNQAPPDWVDRVFRPQMRLMMWFAFKSALHRMNKTPGFFSMVGADFIIDANLNIHLIEFSKTPAVHKSKTGDFTERFTDMIAESVEIQLEIHRRQQAGESFAPGQPARLQSPKMWQHCRPDLAPTH